MKMIQDVPETPNVEYHINNFYSELVRNFYEHDSRKQKTRSENMCYVYLWRNCQVLCYCSGLG